MIRRLILKGWSDAELIDLMRRHKPKKEERLFVVASFLVLGLIASVVPFVYGFLGGIFSSLVFYLLLGLLGACFGAVLGVLFIDLERLDHRHHIVLLFVIPIVLFASSHWFLSLGFLQFAELFSHNALIGGLVYASLFTMLYAFMVAKEWNLRIGQ